MRAHPAGKLGEGATAVTGAELCERQFQSTPPARGGDLLSVCKIPRLRRFRSTPPARGATAGLVHIGGAVVISIHAPPRGGRHLHAGDRRYPCRISIHAPREGGDVNMGMEQRLQYQFQSTPPARGATPRSSMALQTGRFQSTPPARGATRCGKPLRSYRTISIHAPHEGGDLVAVHHAARHLPFQSTPPTRGATPLKNEPIAATRISIHAPREGGDTTRQKYW